MDPRTITDPSFLKNLTIKELEALSGDIRAFLIEQLSKTGGHFSSNMGIVELTIAMHKVFGYNIFYSLNSLLDSLFIISSAILT